MTSATFKNYRGLYHRLQTEPLFILAQEWGVHSPFLYMAARDHGEVRVKQVIFRISKLKDSYFQQKYGPTHQQRGRIFNNEMQKIRQEAESKVLESVEESP